MKHYSDEDRRLEICVKLAELREVSYVSKKDGCEVSLVNCDKCDKLYLEEFETARAITIRKGDFLCLACDDEAEKPAFTGVTIEFGWRF